jgi:hypothetical protein
MDSVLHRPGCENDLAFVYDAWLSHVRDQQPWRRLPKHVFSDPQHGYRRRVDGILERARIMCAVADDKPDLIYAFLVYEPPNAVHFAYTKERFHRLGLFRGLLAEAVGDYAVQGPLLYTERCKRARQWDRMTRKYNLMPNPRAVAFSLVAEQGDGRAVVAMVGPAPTGESR